MSSHSRNDAVHRYLANPIRVVIGDVKVAQTIEGNVRQIAKGSPERRAIVARRAEASISRGRGDEALWGDAADTAVVPIRDIHVERRVNGDSCRIVE